MVEIVVGSAIDVDTAVDIYVRSSTGRLNGKPPPSHRVADITSSLQTAESWFFLAQDGDVPVAMAHLKPGRSGHGNGTELIPGLVYLYLIFVVPERWGEGIGGQLLDFLIVDAKQRGYERMSLHTQDDNDRSHVLYRSRDFVTTGHREKALSDPTKSVSEWARAL